MKMIKVSDCVEKKLDIKCDGDGGVTGQSTTWTSWKFDAISRRNSTAPDSTAYRIRLR